MRKPTSDRQNERLRLKYSFIQTIIQTMGCLCIVAGIAAGGVILMARGNDKGLTVLTAIIGPIGGYFVGKRAAAR